MADEVWEQSAMRTVKRIAWILFWSEACYLPSLGLSAYGYWGLEQGANEASSLTTLAAPMMTKQTTGTNPCASGLNKDGLLERGADLVKQANCAGCHTAIGGKVLQAVAFYDRVWKFCNAEYQP